MTARPGDACSEPPAPLAPLPSITIESWDDRPHSPVPGDPRRYFSVRYDINRQTCVLLHLNGIAVACLAPGHPVVANKLEVIAVDFKVGPGGADLAEQTVSGKKKNGATTLHPGSPLCALLCSNGERHVVFSGVKGALVTVNKRLLQEPWLVADDALGMGHVGIIMLRGNGAIEKLEDAPSGPSPGVVEE